MLPIAIGIALVIYSYQATTPEERSTIIAAIKNANLLLVGLSVFLGFLSHISRAIRWRYLLRPLGYDAKLANAALIVFISYFANLLVIRSGEILRPTALDTYEKVPFQVGFGTVVTERIIDLIMLLLVILLALFLQTNIILGILEEKGIGLVSTIGILALGIIGLIAAIKIIKASNHAVAIKLKAFLGGMLEGVTSVFKMKNKSTFILHTFFIWICYVGMFWVIKYTVPETEDLTLGQLLVAFIAGSFAMTATNGGLGLFPIAVTAALAIFGIDKTAGDAFGWILWSSQNLMLVVLGTISFLLLPLLNRTK